MYVCMLHAYIRIYVQHKCMPSTCHNLKHHELIQAIVSHCVADFGRYCKATLSPPCWIKQTEMFVMNIL